jgi:hypothetical protein
MYLKLFLCFILIQVNGIGFAQINIVPNYSFESYTTCPNTNGRIYFAYPWFQPNKAAESSEFFHSCNYPSLPNVPYCFSGYQYAKTGNGYAGIVFFNDTIPFWKDNNREYIEVGLNDTLKANGKYCIKLNVVKGNYSIWAIKNIQAVLTNDSLLYFDTNFGYITGQNIILEADLIIKDTLNWTLLKSVYTAIGGERFITIGNFSPGDSVTRKLVVPYSTTPNTWGYYLIDDVSVYELPDYNAGNDTTICPWHTAVIGPQTVRSDVTYSWSPTAGLDNPNIANPTASPLINMTYILTVTDTCQWACNSTLTDTVNITVTGCVGVEEFEIENLKFEVYPNPANETVFIEVNIQNAFLVVVDVYGRIVRNVKIEKPSTEINTIDLANGIYYLRYKNKIQKLIIQR